MIAPALPRWVADRLADVATGVNALSPQVPRALLDSAPPEVSIYNAIDSAWVARSSPVEGVTPDLWIMQVGVGLTLEMTGNPDAEGSLSDTATVVVHLAGVTSEGDNAAAVAAAYRIMRATRRCLNIALREFGMEDVVLEGQAITAPETMSLISSEQQPGAGQIDLILILPFTIHDYWALGASET